LTSSSGETSISGSDCTIVSTTGFLVGLQEDKQAAENSMAVIYRIPDILDFFFKNKI
jgi:hypothetical protein